MVVSPISVQTWLHPLISMMVTLMLTAMFSCLAWAEPMAIVPIGPGIDTTNGLSFRHEQPGLISTLVPWLAISTLLEAVSIDVGTGPAFFSNYKFGGQNFGSPVQIVGAVGAGFNIIPGWFTEYRLQHFSDASAYGPYKVGVDMHILEINFRF